MRRGHGVDSEQVFVTKGDVFFLLLRISTSYFVDLQRPSSFKVGVMPRVLREFRYRMSEMTRQVVNLYLVMDPGIFVHCDR